MDATGNFQWAKAFGGINDDVVNDMDIDAAGNLYLTGNFQGTVDFDPGSGIANLTATDFYDDIFVQKMDASGNFLWAKAFGGVEYDGGNSISVDATGNVYTTGYFQETVDFDPGTGNVSLTSAGSSDIFVQKMNASGDFLWAKAFGGTSSDGGVSICVDASGNVYTVGSFQGIADFDPGTGNVSLTSAGSSDIFVQKMSASGFFLWAKAFGGISSDGGVSICVDASGNVYTTGYFQGTVDFDPGAGTVNQSSAGSDDIFIHKMDATGNFQWVEAFGGIYSDNAHYVNVDAVGNIYTAGSFAETVDFDPGTGTANLSSVGSNDVFIQKIDGSGNFLWVKAFGGTDFDEANSSSLDASGNIYTTGDFAGTVDFDPGPGTAFLSSIEYSEDIFVHKMSQNTTGIVELGNGIQVTAFPNPSNDIIQISFNNPLTNGAILLTNSNGTIVYSRQFDEISHEQISIEGPSGIYFLTVKTRQVQSVIKLIKE